MTGLKFLYKAYRLYRAVRRVDEQTILEAKIECTAREDYLGAAILSMLYKWRRQQGSIKQGQL